MLVAGVDSSTQSAKVLLCRAEDGKVLARGSAPHPAGTECDPEAWWVALQRAGDGLLDRADAIGVAAQQDGMIALDNPGRWSGPRCCGTTSVRPARRPGSCRSSAARPGGSITRQRAHGLLHGGQAALAG